MSMVTGQTPEAARVLAPTSSGSPLLHDGRRTKAAAVSRHPRRFTFFIRPPIASVVPTCGIAAPAGNPHRDCTNPVWTAAAGSIRSRHGKGGFLLDSMSLPNGHGVH